MIPLFQAFLDTSKRKREIDRDFFFGLEKIALFVTSQQSIKYNNSHKWLNWVTKTKNKFYLIHSHFYHASGIFEINYSTAHKTKNAHTSKIEWPRCTKVKLVFKRTYLCHLGKSHVQLLNIKSNFLFHEFSI